MNSKDILYSKLPSSILDVMGTSASEEKEYNVVSFIQNLLPNNHKDLNNVEVMVKQPFTLSGLNKRRQHRAKKTLLSLSERRKLGLYKLRRKDMKYKDFLQLHNLWKEYFRDYLNLDELEKNGFRGSPEDRQWESVTRLLFKADYHGAILTVSKSLCSSLVGKTGIVVFDTKNTFQMLGDDDVMRIIPKESCVFTLNMGQYTFTILGNQFCIRPTARNSKKIKTLINVDL